MNSEQILDELDRLIAQRSILQHPFYQAWNAGHLTHDDLATYARVYYPHVAAFPDYLATAAELFAARGFHGVSVADLGAACGVSPRVHNAARALVV